MLFKDNYNIFRYWFIGEKIYFVSIGRWLAIGGVFLQAGLLETVALLSQSVADGAHYASLVEDHEMCKISRWNDFVSFANENRNFRRKIPQNKPKHFKIWVWNLDLWRTWRNLAKPEVLQHLDVEVDRFSGDFTTRAWDLSLVRHAPINWSMPQ